MNIICDLKKEYETALYLGAKLIAAGELVAFPTETVYGLGADAMNETAVANIFKAKGRPSDNPLIVHIARAEQAEEIAYLTPLAKKLTQAFWPGPFTAVLKKRGIVPSCVTAGLSSVAVRLPSAKFPRALAEKSGCFIAAPSANLSGKPSPTLAKHVIDDLGGRVPLIIDGGPCGVGVESTVCDLTGDVPVLLRPGGVTAEMIREIAGDVIVHHAVLGELGNERAASPGMKYKHYAPKAHVTVFTGEKKEVAEKINLLYDTSKQKCAVMCLSGNAALYGDRSIIDLGSDDAAAARSIFAALRASDDEGIKRIFFHATDTQNEGLAVMNRMIRAAGHDVENAAQEEKN